MGFWKISAFMLLACAVHVQGKSTEARSETPSAVTEELIRKELERFAPFQEALRNANLNFSVVFSHSKKDENDTIVQYDSVEFRPLTSQYHPSGPKLHKTLNDSMLKELFSFVRSLNMSVVASQEGFSEDGSLKSKSVFAENIKIFYEDGISNIIVSQVTKKMEAESFENFINMLKRYELPVVVHKTLFSETGEVLESETSEYKPRKVKIVSGDMQIGRQLKVAEALKRAFSMKEDGNERVSLLCKYLHIQYPQFHWQAIIGDGQHFVYHKEQVKLVLEGQTYTVIANKAE